MAELPPDIDFDPALDFDEEGEEQFPEEASNRPFIIASLALGGVFILGLICIGLYLEVLAPRQRDAQMIEAAEIFATNTQAVIDAQLTANANTGGGGESTTATEAPSEPDPTDTPVAVAQITDTPVVAPTNTETPEPVDEATSGPSPIPSNTPTRLPTLFVGTDVGAGGGGETPGAGTPTATQLATALPDTGFADEVGAPLLILGALGLIAVMVVARRVRLSGFN